MKTNILAINTNIKNVVNRTFMVKKTYFKYLCAVLILIGTSAHAWGQTPSLSIMERVTIEASDFTNYNPGGANGATVGVVEITTTANYKNTCGSKTYISMSSSSTMTVTASSGKITKISFSPQSSNSNCPAASGTAGAGHISVNKGSWNDNQIWTSSTDAGEESVTFTANNVADFNDLTVTLVHTSVTCPFTFPTSISFSVASGDDHTENVAISGTTGYTWYGSALADDDLGGSSSTSELSAASSSSASIYVLGDVPGTYYSTLDIEYSRYTPYSYYEISIPVTVTVTGCADISDEDITFHDGTPAFNCSTGKWEVTTSWDAVPGATRYGVALIEYNPSTSKYDITAVAASYQTGTSKTYTVLESNKRYKVAVQAQNEDCIPDGKSKNVTTLQGSSRIETTCASVTAPTVTAVPLSHTANVSWSSASTTCDNTYTVSITKHSNGASVYSQTTNATTNVALGTPTPLESNTRYDVSVTAQNGCGSVSTTTNTYFTTAKELVDYRYACIEIDLDPTDGTSNPLLITSAAGQKVKAIRTLTLSVDGGTVNANKDVTLTGDNLLFYKSDGTLITGSALQTNASGDLAATPIYVAYNPTAYVDENWVQPTITVSCDGNNIGFDNLVHARCLPDNFVIASKLGDHWYALTANCASSGTYTGVLITVDNDSDPSSATAPIETKWGMREVASTRYAANGTNMTFTEKLTTETANDQKTLYNGSSTAIQVYAQYNGYTITNPDRYEWTPTTNNLRDYTLTSADGGNERPICLSTSGSFGTYSSGKAYDGKVRLLPATFEDPAEMQVIEWKANSVVVMYKGSGVSATTQVGSNTESSAQTLTAKKIDHGVFELTTNQVLTSNTNKLLTITIFNGSAGTVGSKIVIIPAIVSGEKNADALVADVSTATTTDLVVLDGATLSAVATKYTYNNITVYPGGKLVIGSGKRLGMASLTLRGGSSWGAATYEHKYPQFVVNNTASGAFSNTSAVINYDYVTTKDQYYSFVLPYASNTKSIKYPLDIYGSAVSASNTGSFEFQYYDGAARAAGGTGWAVLAEDPSTGAVLVAGKGYTFLGMPKKVDAYDGTDDSHANSRQRYGIHRIPMSVSAATVQAGETNSSPGKSTPISVTLADKNNASGWVLVGNPFMDDITGLDNDDIQVGNLIHSDTNPWDGKWRWNPESSQRFVVIPGPDGTTYESEEVSTAELPAFKNFFVQIKSSSVTSLVIPASSRNDAALAPARFKTQAEKDIRLAVDLVGTTRSDKVDLLINDAYSAGFDEDADFTKMMNGTNFNLYGVYPEDYLSFIAVDKTTAAGSIAIGYQVPEGGEYTLQLSDRAYVMTDAIEALYVTDHEVSPEVTTDLLDGPYNFTVNQAETNNTRFTVSIRLAPQTPTDIGNVPSEGMNADNAKPQKFIYHDKMFILRNGVIYDATGKQVKGGLK